MPIDARIAEHQHDVLLVIEVETIITDNTKADWWVHNR